MLSMYKVLCDADADVIVITLRASRCPDRKIAVN